MSRYHKKITPDADGLIDLYAIAEAFGVKSNPQFHAFKKTIMAGQRGDKGVRQDIDEAIQALQRWKEMVQAERVGVTQFNAPPLCSACGTSHYFGECPMDSINCPGCSHDPAPHLRTKHCSKPTVQACPRCLGRSPAGQPCPTCFRNRAVGAPTPGET